MSEVAPAAEPLPARAQFRNVLLFAATTGCTYLAAPVSYIGLVQGALFKELEASDELANIPASAYQWAMVLPLFIAALFPQVRFVKLLLSGSWFTIAAMNAVVATVLLAGMSPSWVVGSVIVHAAFSGCFNGVAAAALWEILGRSLSVRQRGWALGLAFGAGPILAACSSLGAQALLAPDKIQALLTPLGIPFAWKPPTFPVNFALLYLLAVPVVVLAGVFGALFVLPHSGEEARREPVWRNLSGAFFHYFSRRVVLVAGIAYILVYAGGNAILDNISLYTRDALGESPDKYVGLQLFLRFGVKAIAGFGLGMLVARIHAKSALVATALTCLAGVLWARFVPGHWYLFSFGILGAGELFGTYYPNYLALCSPAADLRRNMALVSMMPFVVGFAPWIYGMVSDRYSLARSFDVAIGFLLLTLLLVATLPKRPRPDSNGEADEPERG